METLASAASRAGIEPVRARLWLLVGPAFFLAVGCAALKGLHWMDLPVVDDAAISVAYGLSFWEGFGLRLTHDSPIVEGFSSPAWALLTGLGHFTHVDSLVFAKWTASVLGVLGVALLSMSEAVLERRSLRPLDGGVLLLSLAFPSLAFWLASGMETGLHLFVMVLAYLLAQSTRVRGELLGVFFAALLLVRPELVLAGAGLTAWWSWQRFRSGDRNAAVRGLAGLVGGLLLLLASRRLYFSEWLPNTFFVKRRWDFNGGHYLWTFLQVHAWSFAGALLASVVLLFTPMRARLVSLLLIIGSGLVFGFASRGDWMREWRFLVWVLPFLVTPLLLAWTAVRTSFTGRRLRVAVVALLVASGLSVYGAVGQVERFAALKTAPEFPAFYVMNKAVQLKQTLDTAGVLRPHLGLPDIGGLALVFRDSDVSDVAGLADYALAHAPGTAAMEDYLLNEGPPLVIEAHGPSGHVAFKALKPWFEGWGGGLAVMTGLTRDEDPRCPGEKGALRSTSSDGQALKLRQLMAAGKPVQALRFWRCAQSYSPELERLSGSQRESLGSAAERHALRLESSDRVQALRFWSLATVLAGNGSALRRHTEQLRAELFPGEAER